MNKILIVDHDKDTLKFLANLFNKKYQYYSAECFQEFLVEYTLNTPHLVIANVDTSDGKTVFHIFEYIRKRTPIIALTGEAQNSHQLEKLMTLGVKVVIMKPFKQDLILEMCEKHCPKRVN